jgi:hypothetical protein
MGFFRLHGLLSFLPSLPAHKYSLTVCYCPECGCQLGQASAIHGAALMATCPDSKTRRRKDEEKKKKRGKKKQRRVIVSGDDEGEDGGRLKKPAYIEE